MWNLVEKLLMAFDTKDYNHFNQTYDLFHISNPKEIHVEGIRRLKECYEQGLCRINLIYTQEILKTPENKRKYKKRFRNTDERNDLSRKRIRRIQSKEAIEILAPMVSRSLPPTKEEVQQYLIALEENIPASDIWDESRVMLE
ncbi:hypothetical protein Glove_562g1 [Diversispora epigaea]|uniref:Uncharacterized protein n=1 Tax=Diversispora epigaea TaxID=1348612 RepID=A0A397GAK6_9GLOM|nr:hypothetical protein Glove_562g1 [Diversispora epigaea]